MATTSKSKALLFDVLGNEYSMLGHYDRYSFSEREAFTVEHMEDILDSVDRPLTVSLNTKKSENITRWLMDPLYRVNGGG